MTEYSKSFEIAYLFQSAGVRLSDNKALQIHMYHIVKGLQEARHRVTWVVNVPGRKVLCTEDLLAARSDDWQERHCAKLGLSGSRPLRAMESAMRRVQSELRLPYFGLFDSYRMVAACRYNLSDCDLFHERYNLMSIGGALASRRMGIPFVLEVNADMLDEYDYLDAPVRGLRRLFARWATRFSLAAARRIICVSNDLKTHMAKQWAVPLKKMVVLPNAADVQAFSKTFDPQVYRQKLGLNSEPVVIFVGGFYRWHALDLLVESFARTLRQVPEARLVLVGDGRARPLVEEKISQCGIADSVIVTGTVEHERIPAMLSTADVAVAPFEPFFPWKGGSALKVFEYMAAGKAIVATATGQVAEVIQDGYNGLLVERGDVNGFADAIVKLLNDPAERARLGQNACRQAAERHSWERYIEELENIYAGLL